MRRGRRAPGPERRSTRRVDTESARSASGAGLRGARPRTDSTATGSDAAGGVWRRAGGRGAAVAPHGGELDVVEGPGDVNVNAFVSGGSAAVIVKESIVVVVSLVKK